MTTYIGPISCTTSKNVKIEKGNTEPREKYVKFIIQVRLFDVEAIVDISTE